MSAYTDADVQAVREAIKEKSLDRFTSDYLSDDARIWLAGFAARAALEAIAPAIAARAWDEGHATPWQREMDDCRCGAWNRGECGCGKYGTGRLVTPNPHRTP